MKKLFFLVIIAYLFTACNKDDGCGCFESTGKDITENRDIGDFNNIELSNNINLEIIQDTVNSITITGGKNVLKGVETYCKDDILYIKNNNKCNWARSFKRKINAVLRVKKLNGISYDGTGTINSENALQTDIFTFDCWEGAGDIELKIYAYATHINMHTGTSNIQVSGKSKNNYIYTFSYGKIDCKDLHCQNLYITHRGTNDCFVYATGEMIVNIRYIGNVYYYGNPSYIESKIESTGQLIPLY